MTKVKTNVALILDRSGSMHTIAEEAVEGYNVHIRKFKENTEEQDVSICLVTFNSNVYEHYWLEDAKNVEEARQADYNPNGTTALFDAMGYTIDKLVESTDTKDTNNAYLVITISDGMNNASKHYDCNGISRLIHKWQDTKHWTFSFMGCSERDLKEIEVKTGIPIANCAVWANDKGKACYAYARSADRVGAYMTHRLKAAHSGGTVGTSTLYSDNSVQCANFVDPGSGVVGISDAGHLWLDNSAADLKSICNTTPPTMDCFAKSINYDPENIGKNVFDGTAVIWK